MALIQQVVTLTAGQSIVLPAGAHVDSYILGDGASLSSSCDNLPPADTYTCIRLDWAESDAPDPGALEDGEIESVEIGGTVYPLHIAFGASVEIGIADVINALTGPVFIVYTGAKDTGYDDRTEYSIGVKVPASLIDTVKFKIIGTGFTFGAYVISDGMSCECITVTSGGDQTESFCNEDEIDD